MIIPCVLITMLFSQVFAYEPHLIGLQNFIKVAEYKSEMFTDISDSAWYFQNITAVYNYGLMNGISNTQFNPNGNITIAQAITVAARINKIYCTGDGEFIEYNENDMWYAEYVNYALETKLIDIPYTNYNIPATRAEFAKILAASVDPIDLEAINIVDDISIPAVDMSVDYADAVYLLYRAGVLSGSDANGTFNPDSTITRAEAAAIITRIVEPNLRKQIELVGEY